MNSIQSAIVSELSAICKSLNGKYPGLEESLMELLLNGREVSMVVPVAPPAPGVAPEKEGERKRVVSKKMTEAFMKLAMAEGKSEEEAKAAFEGVKKAYKAVSEKTLMAKGGSFDGFAKSFLAGDAESVGSADSKEKKTRAKLSPEAAAAAAAKRKATIAAKAAGAPPSRVSKWTPTLVRTLTKIVEESGGVMQESVKAMFEGWVNARSEDEFKACEMEGHIRTFATTVLTQMPSGGGSNAAAASPAVVEKKPVSKNPMEDAEEDEEDDDDLEDLEFGGENLLVSSKTDRIYKKTPTGNIWIGNAGAGRFAKVPKHDEE
jgi:hypothetical protein